MRNFPNHLLLIPKKGTEEFNQLAIFLDSRKDEVLMFFPWFTAELLEAYGAHKTLEFLSQYSSRRVTLNTILNFLPKNEIFNRSLERNCTEGEYVEMQSAAGFYDVLRRFMISNHFQTQLTNVEIAARSGTSIRSVQRLRKKFPSLQTAD